VTALNIKDTASNITRETISVSSIDHITIFNSQPAGWWDYLAQVWKFRSLSLAIARRDLKVRYSQTLLGVFWAVLQPLTGLVIFTVFFDRLIKIDTHGVSYPLFAFSGMVAWLLFSHIVHNAGTVLVQSQDLIRKVYFPRVLLLWAKVLGGLVELGISLVLLFLLILLLGNSVTWRIVFLPAFVILNIAVGLSIAVWLSALTVRHRDLHHIIPYLVNFGIWLTPVFYPMTLLPPRFEWLMHWNPMAATIAGFRWSLIGGPVPERDYLLSLIPTLALLLSGFVYFRKVENEISDYV
jgi:lipopolysaccharide transport system permease protein